MKLYSSALCFGLLVVMYCHDQAPAPPVVADTHCRADAYAVGKILSLSKKDQEALPLAQLQANASIVRKYRKDCPAKK